MTGQEDQFERDFACGFLFQRLGVATVIVRKTLAAFEF